MRLVVKGKNLHVGDALKEHAIKKISKLEKFFNGIMEGEVEFTVEKNPSIHKGQHVEVTLYTKGSTIRAKQDSDDVYSAVDQVVDKLERQITTYKGKAFAKHPTSNEQEELVRKSDFGPSIVKSKQFVLKPMSAEEAMLQLELLGHDFYLFRNSDTGQVNVIYKRRDGDFGLIEPT